VLLGVSFAMAGDGVKLGECREDPPTLICLGFVWDIEGDDNRNATASVEYRKAGEAEWKSALPLMRTGGFHVGRSSDWLDHIPPPGLAGSILDLVPDTEYEIRLTAKDPDGVEGQAVQTFRSRTRAEPVNPVGGRVYHVFPPTAKAEWTKNQFSNLYKAYYGGLGNLGDFNMVWERIAQPGDTILVHAGVYKANLKHYTDAMGLVSDGTYWLTAKGTREKPIVIKSADDGEVVFDGAGAEVLFNVMAADYHTFDGLTFRNCGYVIFAGQQRITGCVGLTVRNCRFEDVRDGIYTLYNGSKDFYIADNVFVGRNARDGLTGWGTAEEGFLKSNTAITLQGSGHVVCHNSISYFWQGYHMGTAFQGLDKGGIACDIYNNEMHMLIDDGVEVDGCVRNVRVLRNRLVDAGCPISAQPVYGGPAYLVRNTAYGGRTSLKFHEAWPSGMAVYHNTLISNIAIPRGSYTNADFRNNLFLTSTKSQVVMAYPSAGHQIVSDHNGYQPDAVFRISRINGADPIMDKSRDPYWPLKKYPPASDNVDHKSLAALTEATGLEEHGIMVGYEIFEDLQPFETMGWKVPGQVHPPSGLSFALKPGGAAVDTGVALPNVNEGYEGKAPDLGAYEIGQPAPRYGPRGSKDKEAVQE
jgi:hypothetical protein